MVRPITLQGVKREPRHIVWELTNACNLNCVHCESASGEARDDELSIDEALELCVDLKAIGCRLVNLSGGELFLRPDWLVICERLVSLGMAPIIVSNLTNMKEEWIDAMAELGIAWVATSLDGPKDAHDRIRRTRGEAFSPFERTLSVMHKLKERGFKVSAITHISLWNIDYLDELAAILEQTHIDLWQLQIGFPAGRLLQVAEEYLIYPGQLPGIHEFIVRVKKRGKIRLDVADNIGYFADCEPLIRGRGANSTFWKGCMAGYRVLSISSDGTVKGCPSLDIAVGNIRDRRLPEIWNDESLFWFNSQWDETKLEGKCRGCPYRRICRCGCKSLALSTTGSIYRNIYCINQIKNLKGDSKRREVNGRVLS